MLGPGAREDDIQAQHEIYFSIADDSHAFSGGNVVVGTSPGKKGQVTAETLPWYLRLYGVMFGAIIPESAHQRGALCGNPRAERLSRWTMTDLCYLAMTGKMPTADEAPPFQILVGLPISNGPGADQQGHDRFG